MFFKLRLFSVCTHKREITLCSHPAENMHKPKVYMKGQGPSPKLVVGMVQSCESQAPVGQERAGLKCWAGCTPAAGPKISAHHSQRSVWCPQSSTAASPASSSPPLGRGRLGLPCAAQFLHSYRWRSRWWRQSALGEAEGGGLQIQGFHRGLRRGKERVLGATAMNKHACLPSGQDLNLHFITMYFSGTWNNQRGQPFWCLLSPGRTNFTPRRKKL